MNTSELLNQLITIKENQNFKIEAKSPLKDVHPKSIELMEITATEYINKLDNSSFERYIQKSLDDMGDYTSVESVLTIIANENADNDGDTSLMCFAKVI